MDEKQLTRDEFFKKMESVKEYPLLSTLYKTRRLNQSMKEWMENIPLDYLTLLTENEFMGDRGNKNVSGKRVNEDILGTIVTLHQISFNKGIGAEELVKIGRVFQYLLSALWFNKTAKEEWNYSDKVFYIDFPKWDNYQKFGIEKNPEIEFKEKPNESRKEECIK